MAVNIYKLGNMTVVDDPSKDEKEYYLSRYCKFGFDGEDVCWINYLVDNKLIYKGYVSGISNFYGVTFSDKESLKNYLLLVVGVREHGDELGTYKILDIYPASAAFSLRKVSSSATKSVKIRRSSDDSTTDVILNEDDGLLLTSLVSDGGTLSNWVGSNSAYIMTWYDQSVNGNNLHQSDISSQPRVVNNGALETKGVVFDGVNDNLEAANSVSLQITGDMSAYSVFNPTTILTTNRIIFVKRVSDNDREYEFRIKDTETRLLDSGNSVPLTSTNSINTDYMQSFDRVSNTSVEIYKNGVSGGTQGLVGTQESTTAKLSVGSRYNPKDFFFSGGIKEIIIWGSNQASNRSVIETDINDFYSIY